MLLLTHPKYQYYDFFLWTSWCIVIEAENTSQMLEEYMTVHLRGLSCHTTLFIPQLVSQCVFLPLKLPVTSTGICVQRLSGYLRHSTVSVHSCFPPQHDTPGFLCEHNWQRCFLQSRCNIITVNQILHKMKSRALKKSPHRIALCFILSGCSYQKQ